MSCFRALESQSLAYSFSLFNLFADPILVAFTGPDLMELSYFYCFFDLVPPTTRSALGPLYNLEPKPMLEKELDTWFLVFFCLDHLLELGDSPLGRLGTMNDPPPRLLRLAPALSGLDLSLAFRELALCDLDYAYGDLVLDAPVILVDLTTGILYLYGLADYGFSVIYLPKGLYLVIGGWLAA